MMIRENLQAIRKELPPGVRLVAVSKFHPLERLQEAYEAGQRLFGENRPQELAAKAQLMPADTEWHFIGHLQTNKIKQVLPYVSMVESVDSLHLLQAVEDWGARAGRVADVLLEQHISREASKQGFSGEETLALLERAAGFPHVRFRGLMGMASLTGDEAVIGEEFARIAELKAEANRRFPELTAFDELSIGMSGDWRLALRYGATIIRLGTAIFGPREY